MTQQERISEVLDLSEKIKRPIAINRFIRQKIVQEELVYAYQTPVPSAVQVDNKNKMVEVGDWVIIRKDGTQDSYKQDEFKRIFEVYEEQQPKPKE